MAILPIIEVPDPRLREVSQPVAAIDDDIKTLIGDMFETMYAAPGIGLAAIQVAQPLRLLVIDLQEAEEEDGEPVKRPMTFINPEILEQSTVTQLYNEGCLSIPDQYAEVERPDWIRARWMDEKGETRERRLDGLLGICVQHEIDHLNGVLFTDHLSRMKRDMLMKKLAKQRKAAA